MPISASVETLILKVFQSDTSERENPAVLEKLLHEAEVSAESAEAESAPFIKVARGQLAFLKGDQQEAIKLVKAALKECDQQKNGTVKARILPFLSMLQASAGNLSEALRSALKSIHLFERLPEKKGFGYALYMLGTHYLELNDFDMAERQFDRALEVQHFEQELVPASKVEARLYIAKANVKMRKRQFEIALEYLQRAIELQEYQNDLFGKSRSLNDIGKIYQAMGLADPARKYFNQSLEIREKSPDKREMVTTLLDVSALLLDQRQNLQAKVYLRRALNWAQKLDAPSKVMRAHQLLCVYYKSQRNFEMALNHHEQFVKYRTLLAAEENRLKIKNLTTRYGLENSAQKAELDQLRNKELKKAQELISRKNHFINESITYAYRVQQAFLPDFSLFEKHFQQAFLFNRPKDIVSGDFYWCHAQGNQLWFALADCTGHAVSGSLMSLIGMELLNQLVIVKPHEKPNSVLCDLHSGLRFSLDQKERFGQDGMEIGLCCYDAEAKEIWFSGAKISLWIKSENAPFRVFKANNRSVGSAFYSEEMQFELHRVSLQEKDELYLFTDGITDQFGGDDSKKLKRSGLDHLLKRLSFFPFDDRLKMLKAEISSWVGEHDQLDDMLLLACKV